MVKSNITNHISFFLLTIIPFGLLIGSAVTNIILVISSVLFLICARKEFYSENKEILIILLIFWISLIINALFSNYFYISIEKAIGFLRYFFFTLFLIYCFKNLNNKKLKLFYLILSLLFFFITIDLIFEFLSGKNFFGNQAYFDSLWLYQLNPSLFQYLNN